MTDMSALPHLELVEQALRTGTSQCQALNELARRVREKPSEWKIQAKDWGPLSRPPNPHEIELAFLELSRDRNDSDGEFSCAQDARIQELEARADVDHGMVTEYMNCVVTEMRKVEEQGKAIQR